MVFFLRLFALIFGLVFLLMGLLGFFPNFLVENQLLNVFRVNFWLNVLHTATGIFGIIVAMIGAVSSKMYFQIAGIIYVILSILGFAYGEREILDILANNKPNTWLHVILAVTLLIIGYGKD